jgi:hypothetical protein
MRRLLWFTMWAFLPILVVVLLAAAVQAPVLLVPAVALMVGAWVMGERWNWPRAQRSTAIAIWAVVLAAFLMQKLVE